MIRRRAEKGDKQLKDLVVRFLQEEQGQDLVEYTMLMAFVCLAAAALFIPTGKTITSIWSYASATLASAASAAATS